MSSDTVPRACRIVCTLGPASMSADVLEKMLRAGMNVARLNFSHGTHDTHRQTIETLRHVARRLDCRVAVLQDLQGHKVRTGVLAGDEPISLREGEEIRVGYGTTVSPERIGVDYARLTQFVDVGHSLYLDDGAMALEVQAVEGDDLVCRIRVGGELGSRKGVIFPDSQLDFPLLNDKDLDDARFGVELGVDMVAMSFVRSAAEIQEMRTRLGHWGVARPFLVAKIEERKGIENLGEILQDADAIMIARGDMGVTLPREQVPAIQKSIIRQSNALGVPAITATQMLESMMDHTQPTRAEVNDVYNAVLDGTDAVMLSGETASGRYPVLTVREMDRICRSAEEVLIEQAVNRLPIEGREGIAEQIEEERLRHQMAAAAGNLARGMRASCILGFSRSGRTLRALSAARCPVPIYGVMADDAILRQLLLHWGLSLMVMPAKDRLSELVNAALERLRAAGIVKTRDRVLVVASTVDPNSRSSYLLQFYVLD
jgi:pyruvate kinase